MSNLALISPVSGVRYCIAHGDTRFSKWEGGTVFAVLTVLKNGVKDMKTRIVSVVAVVLALASPASSQESRLGLGQNEVLNDSLFAILVADEIRNNCDALSGKVLKGIGMLWNIVSDARSQGYSDAEINAYRNSAEAKAILRARGDALMVEKNVTYDDPESFCRWGREEIAANSLIGSLLRAK